MKPKKVKTYERHIANFWKNNPERFEINNREYFCVKKKERDEWL